MSVTQEKLFVCFFQCLVFIFALINAFQMEKQVIEDESGEQRQQPAHMAPRNCQKQMWSKSKTTEKEVMYGFNIFTLFTVVKATTATEIKQFTYDVVLHQTYKIVKQQ